jgi:hypothetical protein
MARINTRSVAAKDVTHEGAIVFKLTPEQELRRSVLANLLWEDNFYEDGVANAERIRAAASKVDATKVANLAKEARNTHGLRHVPLLLLTDLIKRGGNGVAQVITDTIGRVDEITELAAIYWKFNPNKDFSAQMKKGLGGAFNKFNEYQFAKYNRDGDVKLRDVLFLAHPKAKDGNQQVLFDKIVKDELTVPDTWEVNLSAGADKKETFERLIREGKLGYLALLRNLRGMDDVNVDRALVKEAIFARKGAKGVLPFQFLSAMKHAPAYTGELEEAMLGSLADLPKLKGHTVLIVDVSGSMQQPLSQKSSLNREEAAAAVAMILRETTESISIYANGTTTKSVPLRRGVALASAIKNSGAGWSGIELTPATKFAKANETKEANRVIVITDGQDTGRGSNSPEHALRLGKRNYIINVAPYRTGIGYGPWLNIDGFSEAVVDYILAYENANL